MNKILRAVLCLTLVLTGLWGTVSKAYAEETAPAVVCAYQTGDTLYAFLDLPDGVENLSVGTEEIIGGGVQPQRYFLRGGTTYVLLVDSTASMKPNAEAIEEFAGKLMENTQLKPRVIVLPFQKEINTEAVIDTAGYEPEASGSLQEAMKQLVYSNDDNAFYSCVIQALDWIDVQFPAAEGDLVNLILVTDAIEGSNLKGGGKQDALKRLKESPEVLCHTVMVDGERGNLADLTDWGISTEISWNSNAADAAGEIMERISGLYRVDLVHDGLGESRVRRAVNLFLKTNEGSNRIVEKITAENVPWLDKDEAGLHVRETEPETAETAHGETEPAGETEVEIPEQKMPEEEPPEAPGLPAETDEGDEKLPPEESPSAGPFPGVADSAGQSAGVSQKEEEAEKKTGVTTWLICGGVGLLVLAAVILIAATRKRRAVNAGDYLKMKMEVVSGHCETRKLQFTLKREMIIGRGRECDIVFSDPEVSARNTRVFIENRVVYIEDLNSTNGTALEGMRIFAPNRLRSGDMISIGNVRFKLKF